MGQKVTLGGDRLGSGKEMQQELHEYGFSTHNLEQDFKSSLAPGVLYPFLKIVGTNHDTFDIDLDSFMRTIPTKGPLFGAFKFQMDIFSVPFRLYNGVLHNNPTEIGLGMKNVYLPKIIIETIDGPEAPRVAGSDDDDCQINNTALEKYLGISGIGHVPMQGGHTSAMAARKIQCIPELAYYDIFKNYYANKQEENAYIITPEDEPTVINQIFKNGVQVYGPEIVQFYEGWNGWNKITPFLGENETKRFIYAEFNIENFDPNYTELVFHLYNGNTRLMDLYDGDQTNVTWETETEEGSKITKFKINNIDWSGLATYFEQVVVRIEIVINEIPNSYTSDIEIRPFALKNIDKMRSKLLQVNEMGQEFVIKNTEDGGNIGYWENNDGEDGTGLPYSALVKTTNEGITWNAFKMNGLVLKTYQSDLFNNWLQTDMVNYIEQITSVAVIDGAFTLSSIAMSEKVWNLMNRILVKGSTYEDWQEARYGTGAIRKSETPMYVGGMSTEIMFEEVISTSETNVNNDKSPLGSLGGKGTQVGRKGGNKIHVKMDEPCYIIGICSLTPRICYSQGNDWDRTELDSMEDLHAPELDGIGFQDLIVEKMAWWNTVLTPGGTSVTHRDSAGKQIAWIDYMTAYDKCFGDFAKANGYAFMVLNRNYNHDPENRYKVADLTTYIDPAKYNYAFAYSELDAQNFWCRIHSYIHGRRKMAAQQIPNL